VLSLASGLSATFGDLAAPDEDVVDDDGVRHQLWVLDDPDVVAAWSTRWRARRSWWPTDTTLPDRAHFQAERRAATNGAPALHQVMALVVELSEEQLDVGAIPPDHRPPPRGHGAANALRPVLRRRARRDRSERVISALGESSSLALIDPESAWLLVPREEAYEAARSDLDSSLVSLVLDDLPAGSSPTATAPRRSSSPSRPARRKGGAAAAGDREADRTLGRRTAAHATEDHFFRPKPRTGMVYRTLDDPN